MTSLMSCASLDFCLTLSLTSRANSSSNVLLFLLLFLAFQMLLPILLPPCLSITHSFVSFLILSGSCFFSLKSLSSFNRFQYSFGSLLLSCSIFATNLWLSIFSCFLTSFFLVFFFSFHCPSVSSLGFAFHFLRATF